MTKRERRTSTRFGSPHRSLRGGSSGAGWTGSRSLPPLKPPLHPARKSGRTVDSPSSPIEMRILLQVASAAVVLVAAIPGKVRAQSLDLTVNDVGISIGDSRRVTGIRLNYRDRYMEEVNGINITVWTPYEENRGRVRGLALGLPATGAARLDGIGLGLVGLGVNRDFRGIGVG